MSEVKSKPARYTGPLFVHELPLVTNSGNQRKLKNIFRYGCNVYNATLQQLKDNVRRLRKDPRWQAALAMKKGKERNELLQALKDQYGVSKTVAETIARNCKQKSSIKQHLDDHICQSLAKRAFDAVQQWLFGKRGCPRFKSCKRFDSVEGKSNLQSIRWRNGRFVYGKLSLRPLIDKNDKHGVQAGAFVAAGSDGKGVSFCRLIRRKINGQYRYFGQLVLRGTPVARAATAAGKGKKVSLDIGTQTAAIYNGETAFLETLAPAAKHDDKIVKKLQRKIDRSTRATNPELFKEDGQVKRGSKGKFKPGKNGLKLKAQLAELHRIAAAHRKTEHGTLANRILSLGHTIILEAVSYRAWQKLFGASIARKAPGMLDNILDRKAGNAGGGIVRLPLRHALSQRCVCGHRLKKKLSQRWHDCPLCGRVIHRDLLAALLAWCCDMENGVDIEEALKSFLASEEAHMAAVSASLEQNEEAKRKNTKHRVPMSLGLSRIPPQYRQQLGIQKESMHGVESFAASSDTTVKICRAVSSQPA